MYQYSNNNHTPENYKARSKSTGKRIISLILSAIAFGAIASCTFVLVKEITETKDTEEQAGYKAQSSVDLTEVGTVSNEILLQDSSADEAAYAAEMNGFDIPETVEAAMPSIVAITNTQIYQNYQAYGYFWPGQEQSQTYEVEGSGSGVIFKETDELYYIVTNYHVIEGASAITAELSDGATADAVVVGYDAANDLAIISILKSGLSEETLNTAAPITLGDSDTVKVGESVIAIGNALGYGQSVTTGIISALNREVTTQNSDGSVYTKTLIQTDAAINPGNSGGALLNSKGELIGINTMKASDTTVEGMGYAIPANTFAALIEEMMLQRQQQTPQESAQQVPSPEQTMPETTQPNQRQYGEGSMAEFFEYFFNNSVPQ